MTFIASVIAKKGVAIIADSLVTSQHPVLYHYNFLDYLNKKPRNERGEIQINIDEINGLFTNEPTFTKDYEEKLFQLNNYTAVTTAGEAYINDKNIADLIEDFKLAQNDINNMLISFTDKLAQFQSFFNSQVRLHVQKYGYMGYCTFIITFYEKNTHKTTIYRATINESNGGTLADTSYNYVTLHLEPEHIKVVCDGQNKISENVLYGPGKALYDIFPQIVQDIINRLSIQPNAIPADFINTLVEDPFYTQLFFADIALFNISDLSIQQSVDLASLLMRLEVDFQKYTKNIPTVGGVIKLAVIDENGFRFISGDKIESPKHITV